MRILIGDNTYISIEDGKNRLDPPQINIFAKSGIGKSLFEESIVEEFHKKRYLIIVLADPKDEIEYGYAMFEPQATYHKRILKKEGKKPSKKKVKLYHPFTFNIPKSKLLPEFNFFTLPLKDLGREEFSLLVESNWDSSAMKLMIDGVNSIGNDSGIYDLLHYIHLQSGVKSKKESSAENFYIGSGTGDMKSMKEIISHFKPFRKDYFLSSVNCPLNLNVKEILSDQKSYHILSTYWIKDPKIKEFTILAFMNQIIKNKEFTKYPILFVIPEVRFLCPNRAEGYKSFLAQAFRDKFSTIRNMGRGMASINSSQVWWDVDERVRDSATITFFGRLGGALDIERVSKALKYKRPIIELLSSMEQNCFIMKGEETEENVFRMLFPTHCHAEPRYNFFEMYKRFYKNKMKKYKETYKLMQKRIYDEENKYKKKIEEEKRKEAEEKRLEKINKEKKSAIFQKLKKKEEKLKKLEGKTKEDLIKRCVELREQGLSLRKIGAKVGISDFTVRRYLKEAKKDKDFEDKFLEDEKEQSKIEG